MTYLNVNHNQRLIKNPFSEQDILYLNDTLLTTGFHEINVSDLSFGRDTMRTFLTSLNYYTDVACLTTRSTRLDMHIADLYSLLLEAQVLDNQQRLNEFFVEEFNFDFLWIEEDYSLTMESWYHIFTKEMYDYHVDKFMPVIILRAI